jgi:ribosomal-protein-alanine N-acetyltransferase
MRYLWNSLTAMICYDADTEFYAKVFPNSVPRHDLLRLRKMMRSDLAQVMHIEQQNYAFPWQHDIFEDCLRVGYSCWVCEAMGQILAYGLLSMAAGEAHILNISVAPAEQKQGIGRKMLLHLIDVARGKADTVFLEVRPSNRYAIALYENIGFNEIGIRKNYYPATDGREDALMMALQLFD